MILAMDQKFISTLYFTILWNFVVKKEKG
jgi:hypothetical protein